MIDGTNHSRARIAGVQHPQSVRLPFPPAVWRPNDVAVTFLIQRDRTPRIRLIIDPDTSKVLAVDFIGLPDRGDNVHVVLESGWTDTKPSPPSTE